MEKSPLKDQLKKTAVAYAVNIKKTAIVLTLGVFFIILATFLNSEWLIQYGLIIMTIAVFFWCNATRHLLKYIKTKRLAKEANDE